MINIAHIKKKYATKNFNVNFLLANLRQVIWGTQKYIYIILEKNY